MNRKPPLAVVPGGAGPDALLLATSQEFIERYCAFWLPGSSLVVALWAMATYAFDALPVFPFLSITSPEPASGKSRLLEVLSCIACRAEHLASLTPAALYRTVAERQPTLLIDEAQVLGTRTGKRDLHDLLATGHRKGATVRRVIRGELVDLPVFCPKAVACIGHLSDVLESRSIVIPMRRRLRDERVDPFFPDMARSETENLRAFLTTWADHERARIVAAYLTWLDGYAAYAEEWKIPTLADRQAENWAVLAAACRVVNPNLMPSLGEAARTLMVAEERSGTVSDGIRLLADIRTIYCESGAHFLKTADMLRNLHTIEESGWGQSRGLKPLTAEGLAALLRPFGIRPRHVHARPAPTVRGYEREDFDDAWARYLAPDDEGQEPGTTRHHDTNDTEEAETDE